MQRSLKDYCSSFLKEGLFSAEHIPPPLFLALYSSICTFLFCLSLLHTESHWAATSLVHCGQADDCLPLLPAQLAASSTAPCWQFPLHTGRHSRIPVTLTRNKALVCSWPCSVAAPVWISLGKGRSFATYFEILQLKKIFLNSQWFHKYPSGKRGGLCAFSCCWFLTPQREQRRGSVQDLWGTRCTPHITHCARFRLRM